ncbi:hypothetical protein N7509_013216 [Penicillium cosmopolitanum]|uniref:2EXR domain-containing protein n=1 Tax=Penicillium cosmopolitanum TaxID=1131564 RepID=A0A9W9VEA5_9EURO|nr:uncharacterized protein N7509_013216 [Penicillium cosmopolitanum]KAJ5376330.1 hypothetical protein N7509_013216 [Penicillium cosmopolitanum]
MSEKSFHLFPRLPTELRLEIWRLCLPCRVWETDLLTSFGLYMKRNSNGSYPCEVTHTAKLNGLPPVITRVCQESRYIAHESGSIVPDDFYDDLPGDAVFVSSTTAGISDEFWVDPKRDSVHTNWTPYADAAYSNNDGSALASLAWHSCQVVGRPSFMCDWFTRMIDQKYERFDVFEKVPSWLVIMRTVFIHASFREAAQSGLFGLLGDASVQVVSVSNEEKINALYDFVDGCDCQAYYIDGPQRVSSEAIKQELKSLIIEAMRSDKLVSRMDPAIMFRLCILRCNSSSEEELLSE